MTSHHNKLSAPTPDKALDLLLSETPGTPDSDQLISDIVAKILIEKANLPPASPSLQRNITARAFESSNSISSNVVTLQPARIKKQMTVPRRSLWVEQNVAVGGFMAACLVLGIWLGNNGVVDNLIAAPLDIAGISTQLNQDDEEIGLFEAQIPSSNK